MDIERIVFNLVKRFNTRNPFKLAKCLNIEVIFNDLGDCCGCYTFLKNHNCIIINNSLPDYEKRFVMAHELGHAILHKKLNCYFIRNKTFLKTSIYEKEANTFSAYLLIDNLDIKECKTIQQLSAISGVPEEFIKLRIK